MMEVTACGDNEISWDWESKDKQISKKILKKGWWNGNRPTEGSPCIVKIDTSGCDDFTVPKSIHMPSIDRLKLVIGDGETVFERMLERVLATMNVQEECLVKYLVNFTEFRVKIELIQYEPGTPSFKLNSDEKFTKALNLKERGVQLFKEDRILDAYFRFKRVIQLLIFLNREEVPHMSTYLAVCNNLALCHLKLGNYEHVMTLCGKVLEKEPNNVKCLLRRAAALENVRDFENALNDYKKILQIEANNQRALERLRIVQKEVDDMNMRYTQAVKRMFQF